MESRQLKPAPDKQAQERGAAKPRENRPTLIRRLHSPAVMLTIVVLLLAYLLFYMAKQYGIEGEGGWLGEIGGAVLAILGMIAAAVILAVVLLWLRARIRRRTPAPWLDDIEEGVHHDDEGAGRHSGGNQT